MSDDYAEKLKDPRWRNRRYLILQRDEWRCLRCGFDGRYPYRHGLYQICESRRWLEVHHLYYEAGREPWEYPPEALATLCNLCHEHETQKQRVGPGVPDDFDLGAAVKESIDKLIAKAAEEQRRRY